MHNTNALCEILRAEADRRFGPHGWQSACATFVTANGESEMVRVVNTRTDDTKQPTPRASSSL